MKKTLVLGASPNSDRYSYMAVDRLNAHGHEVFAVGSREGSIGDTVIQKSFPKGEVIDTVTLYLNPERQKEYYQQIVDLKPNRIIFNPGTENKDFETLANASGIQTEEACTLVLLSTDQY